MALLLATALVLGACGDGEGESGTDTSGPAGTELVATTTDIGTTSTTGDEGETQVDGPVEPPDLDPGVFGDSATVDHPFFPLTPGRQLVLDGFTIEDDEQIEHRIVFTTTGLVKVIAGVASAVAYVEDFEEGELIEAEIAFFAQDEEGNVWHMGEYPEEYEEGEFVLAPAWIHGFEGAKAGIQMPANPQPDTPSYPQGWGPAVEWFDRGRVFEVGSQTCVPVDCYEDVLIVDEFDLQEPTYFQVKYYAPGVGNVQVGWKGNDPTGETLELVQLNELGDAALAEIDEIALALEASAYSHSEIYGETEPMTAR